MADRDDYMQGKVAKAFLEFELKKNNKDKEGGENINPDLPDIKPKKDQYSSEIDKFVKEFEVKQQLDKKINKNREVVISSNSFMVKFVIKHSGGVIKNEKQANYFLLGVSILFFIISIYLFFVGIKGNKNIDIQKSNSLQKVKIK